MPAETQNNAQIKIIFIKIDESNTTVFILLSFLFHFLFDQSLFFLSVHRSWTSITILFLKYKNKKIKIYTNRVSFWQNLQKNKR